MPSINSIEPRRAALRALVQLDPAAGRQALVRELRNFRPTLDENITKLLPASAAPGMDDALIDQLGRKQRGELKQPSANTRLLVARYLSAGPRERVKQISEAEKSPCQPEIVAYFLRVEPAYADRMLKHFPWGMHGPPGPCTMAYINTSPRLIVALSTTDRARRSRGLPGGAPAA